MMKLLALLLALAATQALAGDKELILDPKNCDYIGYDAQEPWCRGAGDPDNSARNTGKDRPHTPGEWHTQEMKDRNEPPLNYYKANPHKENK